MRWIARVGMGRDFLGSEEKKFSICVAKSRVNRGKSTEKLNTKL